ncbi:MAG TPA: transposase [Vineibacter terrae]|nr:transposase [Vineibacter terrae]
MLVENALLHFDDDRYKLLAWCVMPNHVHVLVECDARHSLSNVVQSWKSFTAKAINAALRRTGRLWAPDYFDRYVRDNAHFAAIVSYIESNPVKAQLVDQAQDWRWSSAYTARR